MFRSLQSFEKEELLKIFEEAKYYSFRWWVDKLDCRISIARQSVELDWEEALSKLNGTGDFVTFIERQNLVDNTRHMELSFSSTCKEDREVEYFVWVLMSMEYGKKLAEKHNLRIIPLPSRVGH